ncbi:MAG TPA: PhzF family phenazine biosynthesis protein, partial [Negativicutes bacterium]
VFPDADDLDEKTMQLIARQLNLVETVFVLNKNDNYDFELRYFTPVKELPIAGHPTIAAFVALAALEKIEIAAKNNYVIKTKAGLKKITVNLDKDETIVTMEQAKPIFYPVLEEKSQIADVLDLDSSDFIEDLPIQPVDTGLGHLIVPVKSLAAIMKAKRKINPLRELCTELNISEAQLFTFETYNKQFNVHTRNICPREGIEDPGCGVGNAALGAYLLKNKYSEKQEIKLTAEQGNLINMPCIIEIYAAKQGNAIQVFIGGKGKVMVQGKIQIG